MLTLLAALTATLTALPAAGANLLTNPGFENGTQAWIMANSWYAQPADAGLSPIELAPGEGRHGSAALRITGNGRRGLAMQIFGAYPGKYRVGGWVRCQGMSAGSAGILAEWLDETNKWLAGEGPEHISGDRDWVYLEKVVEAPAGTRSIHLDLLTSAPNDGVVWYDGISVERIPSEGPPPVAPVISAQTPEGQEGCLELKWDPAQVGDSVVQAMVYCQPAGEAPPAYPTALLDAGKGSAVVRNLRNGQAYEVMVVVADADGRQSERSGAATATVLDRQAPRPGTLLAEATGEEGRVRAGWWPHVLDMDLREVCFCVPTGEGGAPEALLTVPVDAAAIEGRPVFTTAPVFTRVLEVPPGVTRIGTYCVDEAGNRGDVGWTEVLPAVGGAQVVLPALWTAPPTDQVRQDAEPPAEQATSFALEAMRGQSRSFQVFVKPAEAMRATRVEFGPLAAADGTTVPAQNLAYHFVEYVHLEKNSVATPAAEQVWGAPGEFPDELGDELAKDLPADLVQPMLVRVSAPADLAPGEYTGSLRLSWAAGRSQPVSFTLRVSPVTLPQDEQLTFVYWTDWGAVCQKLGVDPMSEDGWRAARRLGQMMKAYHQNSITVPWSMIRTWRMADGSLRHDFADFDRWVRTFDEAGVNKLFCIQHMGGRTDGTWECPTMGNNTQTVIDATNGQRSYVDATQILGAIQDHVEAMGMLDRFCVHVADEPIPQNVASYRDLSARVRAAAPKLRRIDAIHVPDLEGSLEIWVPQLNYFEQWQDEFKAAQAKGNELWFYIAWVPQGKYPNRMIDSSALKPRVLHWLNSLYDTSGYLHWALCWWNIALDSLGSPGDQYIVWPSGRFVANSSLRYEAEREGLEDCQLMFMLRDALVAQGLTRDEAQARMEAIGRQAVREPQDYTRSWMELEAVRGEMLTALEGAGG